VAAQISLFEVGNAALVEEIRNSEPELMSDHDAAELFRSIRKRIL
jgi:hypothetical protein